MQSRCGGGVAARLCRPGARSGLPCPVLACCWRGRLARAGSGSRSGVELKKKIMMAQRAIARAGRNDPLEKLPSACLKTGPDGWAKPDPLERALWGGAERSRSADGQVRGWLTMLPAGGGRQPGCFQAQTVQAPFVFGSALLGLLIGVPHPAWEHPIIQLRVHVQAQLLERPPRRIEAAVCGVFRDCRGLHEDRSSEASGPRRRRGRLGRARSLAQITGRDSGNRHHADPSGRQCASAANTTNNFLHQGYIQPRPRPTSARGASSTER
jgi:hypothetical protein